MEIAAKTRTERFGILLPYCLGLADPISNTGNLAKARTLFDSVTATETMEMVDTVVSSTDDLELVKIIVTRMLHSFTKALGAHVRPFERGFPYIESILERNDRISRVLDDLKPVLARVNGRGSVGEDAPMILRSLAGLELLSTHYVGKENILFPVVERYIEESRCVQLMWAIHDDIRSSLRRLHDDVVSEEVPLAELNRLFGRLFFDMRSMIFREEQVLFPAVLPRIPSKVLRSLGEQQFESTQADASEARGDADAKLDLVTGNPTVRQLIGIFNNLPVDITLVDEEDRVVYFNTPEHRIFPRAKEVVGRTVQNCHPPRSVHIVQRILDSFREKRERSADFRIFVKGRFIRISYHALYHEDGSYAGTLEVSQDITDLKKMEGEKRLLDWNSAD